MDASHVGSVFSLCLRYPFNSFPSIYIVLVSSNAFNYCFAYHFPFSMKYFAILNIYFALSTFANCKPTMENISILSS